MPAPLKKPYCHLFERLRLDLWLWALPRAARGGAPLTAPAAPAAQVTLNGTALGSLQ